ncbi:hypothetical protein PUN28_020784 [Cardiocondyla obscurior]|uniref:Uncharacterized protein n=1 Tax=Cardiocondyla obscurior TaxID=286306 RepID=A0AAW2E8X8_9HYME
MSTVVNSSTVRVRSLITRRTQSSSRKKRWGTLIEAAKAGRVSRLIGRSRSEDSVYSPASEDGGSRSEGSSDSKSSLEGASHDVQSVQHPSHHHSHFHHAHHHEAHHMFTHGLGPALAALRKKRKKFSASKSSTPAMTSSTNTNPADSSTTSSVATVLAARISSKKQLQRASGVPTRGPELTAQSSLTSSRRHEVTQSQQPSLNVAEINERMNVQQNVIVPLTPLTTEESMVASGSTSITAKRNGSATQLKRLPGIEPISGHDVFSGWL